MSKTTKESIRERIADGDEEMLFCDGLDEALIGKTHIWAGNSGCSPINVALYDYEKCVQVMMKKDGCSYEEAVEFLEFNTLGAYMGERTPAFAFLDGPR